MIKSDLLIKLLHIRKSEMSKVLVMTGHAFFSGLGIALAFSAINLLLLKKHGTEILPVVYMVAMVFLLIVGKFYQKLEHSLSPSKLFTLVITTMTGWAILAFVVIGKGAFWVTAAIYCSYFLIYLLHNLEFWGASALLFDVRESKRVFGFLNSGESMAKILGYALTPVIVAIFDESYLLLTAGIAFGLSLLLWTRITNRHRSEFHISHHKVASFIHSEEKARIGLKDDLLKKSSQLALLGALVLTLVQFAFLNKVDKTFSSSTHLALYFGIFFSTAKFFNLFLELTVSGRILERIGLKRSIMALPLVVAVLAIAAVSLGEFDVMNLEVHFYLFAFMMLSDEILSSSIHKPAFLSLFQPLTKDGRLTGHSISKGISEPIGMGISGLILFLLMQTQSFELRVVGGCILLFGILWIFSSSSTGKVYKELVEKMMRTRILGTSHLESILQSEVDLDTRIKEENDPLNKLYLLQLAKGNLSEATNKDCLDSLLQLETEPNALIETLRFIEKNPIEGLELNHLMAHQDATVIEATIIAIASLEKEKSIDRLLALKETNPQLERAICAALLKNGGLYAASIVGSEVLQWIKSEEPAKRIQACEIIAHTGIENYYQPLLPLLDDEVFDVRAAAIEAAASIKNPALVHTLIQCALTPGLFDDTYRCLQRFESLPSEIFIENLNAARSNSDRRKLIRLVSCNNRHSDESLILAIEKYASSEVFEIRKEAINTLFNSNIDVDANKYLSPRWEEEHHAILTLQDLLNEKYPLDKITKEAIQEELSAKVVQLMKITGLFYQRSVFRRAIDSYLIGNKSELANTIETLDLILEDKHRKKMIKLLEADLEFSHKGKLSELLSRILEDNSGLFSDYLKAILLRNHKEAITESIRIKYQNANINFSTILREELALI